MGKGLKGLEEGGVNWPWPDRPLFVVEEGVFSSRVPLLVIVLVVVVVAVLWLVLVLPEEGSAREGDMTEGGLAVELEVLAGFGLGVMAGRCEAYFFPGRAGSALAADAVPEFAFVLAAFLG